MEILQSFPYNLIGLFAIAMASYYLIERPLIAVGHRLAKLVIPGRRDLAIWNLSGRKGNMATMKQALLTTTLVLIGLQGAGCFQSRAHELSEENQILRDQNDGLKRQLDEANGELRQTKIALERARADLAATKAAR